MVTDKPIICLMGLRPMLLFGCCNDHSDAAVAGQADAPANGKCGKQSNVNIFNSISTAWTLKGI